MNYVATVLLVRHMFRLGGVRYVVHDALTVYIALVHSNSYIVRIASVEPM